MDLSRMIDHTLLKPDCTQPEVKKYCEETLQYGFAAVCIPPYFVKEAAQALRGSTSKVVTVAGFPMGYNAISAKIEEIKKAIEDGADEVDAVINPCAVKNGNWNHVRNEIESFTTACHMRGKIIKVILETGLLTEPEILKLCELCAGEELDFVKTSTGFNGPGATVDVVKLLRKNLPKSIKIKASGGIRERSFAEQLAKAGAERIGSSSGVSLLK